MDPDTVNIIMNLATGAAGGVGGKVVESSWDATINLAQRAWEKVAPDKRTEPARPFAGPLLEAVKHHPEESLLREMFCELLAAGMNTERQSAAHPAFVRVLEHLSSDEAQILSALASVGERKFFEPSFRTSYNLRESGSAPTEVFYWEFDFDVEELDFPENLHMYLEHLTHLNLLKLKIARSEKVVLDRGTMDGRVVEGDQDGEYLVSSFGELFLQACIPPRNEG
jgi:hypothetical protein